MKNSSNKLYIIIVFLAALMPRLILALSSTEIPASDALGYDTLAVNILGQKGFSEGGIATVSKEPLYPFFLASIYSFFGHNYLAVRVIQSILGALVCVFIFVISKNLFNTGIAFLSSLIASFNPGFIKISEHLLTENLFVFLLIVAIFFLLKQAKGGNLKNLILLGITLGLASLTRSVILLFPLFIIFCIGKKLVFGKYNLKRHVLSVFILIFFMVLTIFPWTLRNWRLYHEFIPVVSRTGLGIYSSFLPKNGKYFGFNANDAVTVESTKILSESQRNRFLLKKTGKFIINNPLGVLRLEFLKIMYFLSLFDWEIIGNGVYNFMFGFIFPFFVYGVFISLKKVRELLPIYLPIGYAFFMALLTYGSPRFRLPVEPYIIIIASSGIIYFVNRAAKKKYAVFLVCIYFLFNFFCYLNSFFIKSFLKIFFERAGLW